VHFHELHKIEACLGHDLCMSRGDATLPKIINSHPLIMYLQLEPIPDLEQQRIFVVNMERLPHPHVMGFGTNIILSLELSSPTRVQNPTSSTIDPNDQILGRSILDTIAYTKLHNNQQTICLSSTKFTLDLRPISIHPRY
jgi:hypothetical protein